MLEVRNISYSYRHDARPVLSDVSFQVQQGEHVAILGANGAGKSTLVRMLNGSLAPTQGRVFLDGESVSSLSLRKLLAWFVKIREVRLFQLHSQKRWLLDQGIWS